MRYPLISGCRMASNIAPRPAAATIMTVMSVMSCATTKGEGKQPLAGKTYHHSAIIGGECTADAQLMGARATFASSCVY